jgi:intracellular multiplication protein IcmT
MAGPADWRNTALMAKLIVIDARAMFPFLILIYHPSVLKFLLALAACVFVAVLSYFSYTLDVLFRRLRARLAGRRKAGVAWWHRPQRNLYPYKTR